MSADKTRENVTCEGVLFTQTKSLSRLQRRLLILSVANLPVRLEVLHSLQVVLALGVGSRNS